MSEMTGLLLLPLPKLNPRLIKIHLEYNVCTLKVIEELNAMMAKNADKIEKQKLMDVRRDRREIRKMTGVQFR